MKKLTLALAIFSAVVTTYGQGTVTFANSAGTAVSNSVATGRVAATAFKVTLYYLPWVSDAQVPSNSDFDTAGQEVATTTLFAAGLFNNAGQPVRVETLSPAGGNGWFQIRAWETAYGNSFNEVMNSAEIGGKKALAGTSNIFKVDSGDPTVSPAGQPGNLVNSGLKSFMVYPVPEPAAIGLGLLGFGALLMMRRRK